MNNDNKIKELLAKVETQRKELGEKPRAAWRTNGIFKYSDGTHLNINTVSDKSLLVDALSLLLHTDSVRKSAADILGVENYKPTWNGYVLEDYMEDFKLRVKILNWDAKKKLLSETEAKLKALVSEEARTEMELENISNLLG